MAAKKSPAKSAALVQAEQQLCDPKVPELVLPAAEWSELLADLKAYFEARKKPEEIAGTRMVLYPGHPAHRFPGRGPYFKVKNKPVFQAETSAMGV